MKLWLNLEVSRGQVNEIVKFMYRIMTLIIVNEGPGTANSRKCSQRKAILVVKLADLDIFLKNQLHKWCNFLDLNLLQETFMTFSLHSRYSRRVLSKKIRFSIFYMSHPQSSVQCKWKSSAIFLYVHSRGGPQVTFWGRSRSRSQF